MRIVALAAIGAAAFMSEPAWAQNEACQAVEGAKVVSPDGTYLGKITSNLASDSIFNKFNPYGNSFSSKSIWNDFGPYGGDFNSKSARNDMASEPPLLIKGDTLIGYLSTNKAKRGAISPMLLGIVCYDYEPD